MANDSAHPFTGTVLTLLRTLFLRCSFPHHAAATPELDLQIFTSEHASITAPTKLQLHIWGGHEVRAV